MRTRYAFLAVLLAAALMPEAASADRQYDFEETTLENGLRVVTLEDFSCPIVAVHVWYHVGSKDERPDRQGFAHMFEHMMFRGTDLLGPEEHFALIRGAGGRTNAFTSFDYTAYVNELPSNQLDLALWLEAERMMFLKVDQANFETERQVVTEERRQDLNEPYGAVFEQVMPVVFREHPYRWLPIGKIAHLNEASVDELKEFWDTFYVPNNAVLVIVGAVAHEEAQAKAEQYFGWMPSCPQPPRVTVHEPEQTAAREVTIKEGIGPAPLVRYVYRSVPKRHPDFIPLQVLTSILGGGESSRLYVDLVKEKKLCQEAFAYLYGLEQEGLLLAGAELLPADPEARQDDTARIDAVLAEMSRHIGDIAANSVSMRELDKVKNQLRRKVVTDTLTVVNKARVIGQTTIQEGGPDFLNEELDAIAAVTREDIQRVARAYLDEVGRTTVRVLPEKDYEYVPVAEAAKGSPFSPSPCKSSATRPPAFPKEPPVHELLESMPETPVRERTLENGLRVVVVPNSEVPFVTVMLGLRHGAWTEDPAQPGVASMALDMLTKGTEHYTAAELAETIEFNALTLRGAAESNGYPTMDVGGVTATALSDKLPLAMELMAEVVLLPAFPVGELEILREQRLLSLSIEERDPSYLADRELRRRMYGDHPYARSPVGESSDVKRISAAMLKEWWDAHARPDACTLFVAGDVRPRQAWKLAKRYFGEWQGAESAPMVERPALPGLHDTHVYIVDKPGSVQSQIRMGQISITRGHPDYHPSRVFAQIFGSGFNSRLNRTIRIERGLTYAAWGYFLPKHDSGEFRCYTFTKTETTAETVKGVLEVIDSMRTDPPTADELLNAKSYLVGSFAGQLETPQDTLGYQWIIEYNDLPEDYLSRALDGYRNTQSEDIVRIANEIVDPNKLTIVVVGEADAIKDDLAAVAPVTVIPAGEEGG